MSTQSANLERRPAKSGLRPALAAIAVLILVGAMAYDTKVIKIGGAADVQPGVFSPAAFGASEFPKIQSFIENRAEDAATLATALAKDREAAVKQYGVEASGGPVFPVKFTGVAGKQDFGNYDVKVAGVPDTLTVRVQTGPAILGTELRDAMGTIKFGQFKNQIDYQNAGSALNKQMKKDVLAKVKTDDLTGKTISVVGAFRLTDPTHWLVTPVNLAVQ